MTSNGLLPELFPGQEAKLRSNGQVGTGVCREALLVLENGLEADVPFFTHQQFANGAQASSGQLLNRLTHSYTVLLLEGTLETFKSESNRW